MENKIQYKENHLPTVDAFYQLFETTGWNRDYKFTRQELYHGLQASWYMVSAYDGEQLIGFGRVISDGIMHALITEMIVLPDYQGRGVGCEILRYIKDQCFKHQIRDIQLFSAKGKTGFYEKYGFKRRPENGPGMEIKYLP